MSMTINLVVDDGATAASKRLVRALRAERTLYQRVAIMAEETTKAHLRNLDRTIEHKSARDLGADPSGHLAEMANRIEGAPSDRFASVRGPIRSRLRAAFGPYTVRPTGGRKYIARPAHKEVYGRNPRDFQTLVFAIVGGKWPALLFDRTWGQGMAGTVAFWLAREVDIKEDRTLLPFDAYPKIVRQEIKLITQEALRDDDENGGRA